MEATMDLDIMGATTATPTTATTERDLPRLSLFLLLVLMPKLKQTPGTDTMDTVLVTMVDTMAIPTCMARDLLMQRLDLLPKLRLTRIFFMAMDLDMDIMGAIMAIRTMAMATVTTMASKKGRDPIES